MHPAQEDQSTAAGTVTLLCAADVAAMLRVTPQWVYAATRQNRIPHLRLGRYIRFRSDAIAAWIERSEEDGG